MLDRLETIMNWLTDMDWGWWPILSLRPPKDQDMNTPILLKVTLFYGSIIGALFLLVIVIRVAEALTLGDIIFAIIFCLLLGWILFFVVYKTTFGYSWNRRARRLRRH